MYYKQEQQHNLKPNVKVKKKEMQQTSGLKRWSNNKIKRRKFNTRTTRGFRKNDKVNRRRKKAIR